jgi:hypothetical protein
MIFKINLHFQSNTSDIRKKRKNIGYFDDLELADLVATEARNLYHGAFVRHA